MDVRSLQMTDFETWAHELGVPWSKVLAGAGVQDPKKARASAHRMAKKGAAGAPRVRRKILDYLTMLEGERMERTEFGAVVVGYSEYVEIGARLARLDHKEFLRLLDTARKVLDAAEAMASLRK